MNRFPRTVTELAAGNRRVFVRCDECQRSRVVPSDLLAMEFGPDFDIYDGFQELRAQLRCEQCGKSHRVIDVVDSSRRAFEDVGFDEAVNRQLEFNALARARDGDRPEPVQAIRRRRR